VTTEPGPRISMLRYIRGDFSPTPRPALFLDRDGVLNRRIVDGYVLEPNDFEPLDLVLGAAVTAQAVGAALVVVSNQGAIGRGLATESGVLAIHAVLVAELSKHGIFLDAIHICPHHPKALDPLNRNCRCRKPKPGLILAAARDLNLDLTTSLLIGDQPSDIAAARAAGIVEGRTLLVGEAAPTDQIDPAEFVRNAWGRE
jgi:D-glycero-D-manno-heptose 1,7-bisphosphate phosphatase